MSTKNEEVWFTKDIQKGQHVRSPPISEVVEEGQLQKFHTRHRPTTSDEKKKCHEKRDSATQHCAGCWMDGWMCKQQMPLPRPSQNVSLFVYFCCFIILITHSFCPVWVVVDDDQVHPPAMQPSSSSSSLQQMATMGAPFRFHFSKMWATRRPWSPSPHRPYSTCCLSKTLKMLLVLQCSCPLAHRLVPSTILPHRPAYITLYLHLYLYIMHIYTT